MIFAWIEANRSEISVKKMCRLFEVSRSGFYEWLGRGESARAVEDRELMRKIERSFEESRGVYGTPRILDDLRDQGCRVGKNRIDRLKRAASIFARIFKRFRVQTTDSRHDLKASPNLLRRDFSVIAPNCVWTSDITYVRLTSGAFAYVCVVMDLFSREIVGWSVEMHMRVDLVLSAMRSALTKRGPCAGLIFHSDRGVQYASAAFRELLSSWNILQSMSKKGDCYDNAPTESFNATLKTEEVYRNEYSSIDELRKNLFDYIEVFYNRKRKHSALGYATPAEFNSRYYTA
jgi:putative transposase